MAFHYVTVRRDPRMFLELHRELLQEEQHTLVTKRASINTPVALCLVLGATDRLEIDTPTTAALLGSHLWTSSSRSLYFRSLTPDYLYIPLAGHPVARCANSCLFLWPRPSTYWPPLCLVIYFTYFLNPMHGDSWICISGNEKQWNYCSLQALRLEEIFCCNYFAF